MQKHEQKFQTFFNKFLRYEYLPNRQSASIAFELKYAGSKPLPFDALRPGQKDCLLGAKRNGIAYKISDDSMGYKPFDSFALKGAEAYVVVKFDAAFYMIDIDNWLVHEKYCERRSLTEEAAAGMAFYISKKNPAT